VQDKLNNEQAVAVTRDPRTVRNLQSAVKSLNVFLQEVGGTFLECAEITKSCFFKKIK
jgi:hypothetical protein